MVIADLDELFIPIPDELLVNLSDSREIIETLLDSLPAIHQNARSAETAMGPAIRVAFKLMVNGFIDELFGKLLAEQIAKLVACCVRCVSVVVDRRQNACVPVDAAVERPGSTSQPR